MAKVEISSKIKIIDPKEETINWAKQALSMPNPKWVENKKLGFSNWRVPKNIELFTLTKNNTLYLPYGIKGKIPIPITEKFSDHASVYYQGSKINLYDYQKIAVNKMLDSDYGILQSPAGSGKTQIGIELIKRLGKRTLWLTHTKDLLTQSKNRASLYIQNTDFGEITEGKCNIKNLTFATVQTAQKFIKEIKNEFDVVIVDECHRCSGTPKQATLFYKVLSNINARHKFGLSATLSRSDGLILCTFALLGPIQYKVPTEAIKDKTIKPIIKPIQTYTQFDEKALEVRGRFAFGKYISQLSGSIPRNNLIADLIKKENRPTLVLCHRISQLDILHSLLPESVIINGSTKKEDREQILNDMREGNKQILLATYSLAKEGLDIPNLEVLVLATPQKDASVIEQSVGRVSRACLNKQTPIVYDLLDNHWYSRRSFDQRMITYNKLELYIQ